MKYIITNFIRKPIKFDNIVQQYKRIQITIPRYNIPGISENN